jgi:MYXO-CTERM domain-containing protein
MRLPLLTLSAVLLVASSAGAHIALTFPTARSNDQVQLKTGPCGQSTTARTNKVSVFKPGQTITVTWNETINHPGHYRISFDPNGNNFVNPTSFTDVDGGTLGLVDGISDKTGVAPIPYTQQITFPNIECASCTLQLIQVMTDKPPYDPSPAGNDIYYQCADIVLTNSDAGVTPSDAGGTTDSGGGGDSGGGTDSGSTDGGSYAAASDAAGCACSAVSTATGGGVGAFGLALGALAAMGLRRRRRP